jgi:hypothetical protein
MFTVIILISLITISVSRTALSENPISNTETVNLLTANLPLIYINDQVKKCVGTRSPKSYADCGSAITDPIASCCYMSLSGHRLNMCFPIPNQYPALFKNVYTKLGYSLDCPLINNYNGEYSDELIDNYYIKPNDAQAIFNAGKTIVSLAGPFAKCTNIREPSSFDSCSRAINSPLAKCCYLTGHQGDKNVNICAGIPNETQHIMNWLYQQINVKMDCGESTVGDFLGRDK